MDESVHIDTRLLRDQVSAILEEKRIAQQLLRKVEMLKSTGDDSTSIQLQAIISKVQNLVRYYEKMAGVLEDVGDEAVRLSRFFTQLIRDERDESNNSISHRFL